MSPRAHTRMRFLLVVACVGIAWGRKLRQQQRTLTNGDGDKDVPLKKAKSEGDAINSYAVKSQGSMPFKKAKSEGDAGGSHGQLENEEMVMEEEMKMGKTKAIKIKHDWTDCEASPCVFKQNGDVIDNEVARRRIATSVKERQSKSELVNQSGEEWCGWALVVRMLAQYRTNAYEDIAKDLYCKNQWWSELHISDIPGLCRGQTATVPDDFNLADYLVKHH